MLDVRCRITKSFTSFSDQQAQKKRPAATGPKGSIQMLNEQLTQMQCYFQLLASQAELTAQLEGELDILPDVTETTWFIHPAGELT